MKITRAYELKYMATIHGDVLKSPLVEVRTATIDVDDFDTALEVAQDLIKIVTEKTRYSAKIISLAPTRRPIIKGEEE